jgi:hypothetical protein
LRAALLDSRRRAGNDLFIISWQSKKQAAPEKACGVFQLREA